MSTAEKYVTAAYCAVFALVLVYVVIIALKVQRLEREVDELEVRVGAHDGERHHREPEQPERAAATPHEIRRHDEPHEEIQRAGPRTPREAVLPRGLRGE